MRNTFVSLEMEILKCKYTLPPITILRMEEQDNLKILCQFPDLFPKTREQVKKLTQRRLESHRQILATREEKSGNVTDIYAFDLDENKYTYRGPVAERGKIESILGGFVIYDYVNAHIFQCSSKGGVYSKTGSIKGYFNFVGIRGKTIAIARWMRSEPGKHKVYDLPSGKFLFDFKSNWEAIGGTDFFILGGNQIHRFTDAGFVFEHDLPEHFDRCERLGNTEKSLKVALGSYNTTVIAEILCSITDSVSSDASHAEGARDSVPHFRELQRLTGDFVCSLSDSAVVIDGDEDKEDQKSVYVEMRDTIPSAERSEGSEGVWKEACDFPLKGDPEFDFGYFYNSHLGFARLFRWNPETSRCDEVLKVDGMREGGCGLVSGSLFWSVNETMISRRRRSSRHLASRNWTTIPHTMRGGHRSTQASQRLNQDPVSLKFLGRLFVDFCRKIQYLASWGCSSGNFCEFTFRMEGKIQSRSRLCIRISG